MTPRIWREPPEESDDIYPDLSLHDHRVTGSIVVDHSRLPLWAFVSTAIHQGWDEVEAGWSPTEHYGYTADDLTAFLYDLLEHRGEFGRLLLELAAAERWERGGKKDRGAWWQNPKRRRRVACQLTRCLDVLNAGGDR